LAVAHREVPFVEVSEQRLEIFLREHSGLSRRFFAEALWLGSRLSHTSEGAPKFLLSNAAIAASIEDQVEGQVHLLILVLERNALDFLLVRDAKLPQVHLAVLIEVERLDHVIDDVRVDRLSPSQCGFLDHRSQLVRIDGARTVDVENRKGLDDPLLLHETLNASQKLRVVHRLPLASSL
jgi:hypothetical protein